MTSLMPFAVAWGALAIAVIALAFFRKAIAAKEDDMVHLSGESVAINRQMETARKLEALDKWGKILTIVLLVTGAVLGILYGMQLWDASSKAGLS